MTHVVTVDGVTIQAHLDAAGPATGPVVMVLHGFTGSAAAMEPLTSRLRPRHRTVAVDLVGHGASSVPDETAAYSQAAITRQLAGVVEALGVGPVAVVGYSMGGRIALSLTCARPELVAALVTIGASAGIRDPRERAARRRADATLAGSIGRDGLEAFVDRWMAHPLFATQARLGPDALAAIRRQKLAGSAEGYARSLLGTGTGSMPPLHAALTDVDVPCLFVAGELDERYRADATELAAIVPGGRVAIVPGAGHATHLERPDATADVVSVFLGSL